MPIPLLIFQVEVFVEAIVVWLLFFDVYPSPMKEQVCLFVQCILLYRKSKGRKLKAPAYSDPCCKADLSQFHQIYIYW